MTEPVKHSKFANVVLYLIGGTSDGKPGLTKLLKLLYHSDFGHYRKHLRSITNVTYVAAQRGPVPQEYENLLGTLVECGLIAVEHVPTGFSKPKAEYRANRSANLRIFAETELETLDAVLSQHSGSTGRDLSDKTHMEGPWSWVWDPDDQKQPIPYLLARWIDNQCDEDDLDQAARMLKNPDVLRLIAELDGKQIPN